MVTIGLDIGITIGLAVVKDIDKPAHWEALPVDRWGIVYCMETILATFNQWKPEFIVVEYPNPSNYNVIFNRLVAVNVATENTIKQYQDGLIEPLTLGIVRVTPGQWKPSPARHFDVKVPMSDHERDAIRIAVWWNRFGSKQRR